MDVSPVIDEEPPPVLVTDCVDHTCILDMVQMSVCASGLSHSLSLVL